MIRLPACLMLTLLVLAACGTITSPQQRRENTLSLAAAVGWHEIKLPTEEFILKAYIPQNIPVSSKILTIYIEGDNLYRPCQSVFNKYFFVLKSKAY